MPAVQTQLLADETDLAQMGPLASALGTLSSAVKQANLRRASGEVLAAYGKRMTLPLVQWGDFTKGLVIDIAAFRMIVGPRGVNPSSPDGKILVENYQRAQEILNEIVDLEIRTPRMDPDAIDSTEALDEEGPLAASEGGGMDQADAWAKTCACGSCCRGYCSPCNGIAGGGCA